MRCPDDQFLVVRPPLETDIPFIRRPGPIFFEHGLQSFSIKFRIAARTCSSPICPKLRLIMNKVHLSSPQLLVLGFKRTGFLPPGETPSGRSIMAENRSNRLKLSCGPGLASGWNCTEKPKIFQNGCRSCCRRTARHASRRHRPAGSRGRPQNRDSSRPPKSARWPDPARDGWRYVMAVVHLYGVRAECAGQERVAEADAKNWYARFQDFLHRKRHIDDGTAAAANRPCCRSSESAFCFLVRDIVTRVTPGCLAPRFAPIYHHPRGAERSSGGFGINLPRP